MKLDDVIKTGTIFAGLAFLFKSKIFQKVLLVLFVLICLLIFWIYMRVFHRPASTWLSDNFGFHVSAATGGVTVSGIDADLSLVAADLRRDDFIQKVDGTTVTSLAALENKIQTAIRNGGKTQLTLRVRGPPSKQYINMQLDLCKNAAEVSDTGLIAKYYEWPFAAPTTFRILVKTVKTNSKAATTTNAVQSGDSIAKIEAIDVSGLEDLIQALQLPANKMSVKLQYHRNSVAAILLPRILNDYFTSTQFGINYDKVGNDWKIATAPATGPMFDLGLGVGATLEPPNGTGGDFTIKVKSPSAQAGEYKYSTLWGLGAKKNGNSWKIVWLDPASPLGIVAPLGLGFVAGDDIELPNGDPTNEFTVKCTQPLGKAGDYSVSVTNWQMATKKNGNSLEIHRLGGTPKLDRANLFPSPGPIVQGNKIVKLNDSSSVTFEDLVSEVNINGFVRLYLEQGAPPLPYLFSIKRVSSFTVVNQSSNPIWAFAGVPDLGGKPGGTDYPNRFGVNTDHLMPGPVNATQIYAPPQALPHVAPGIDIPLGIKLRLLDSNGQSKEEFLIKETGQTITFP